MLSDFWLLTLTIFMPTIGALLLMFFDRKAEESMRVFSLIITAVTFGLTIAVLGRFMAVNTAGADYIGSIHMQVAKQWIPTWNVSYRLGVDGISMTLVLLTGLVSLLAMVASWSIQKQVRGYLILFLLLETGMMGVF